ncbi:MAG TPA: hypothetical protein VNU92_16085 [Edaphobacter sp.]|jgi:hypothetical protein|nr:hypothetical protein [Edaphobacter sp.]
MKCEQAQHVAGDIEHYVTNDHENGAFLCELRHLEAGDAGI